MRVLVVNAGSSSVKLRVLGPDDAVEHTLDLPGWGEQSRRALAELVAAIPELDAVGHRVVHGGAAFDRPVVVTPGTEDALLALTALAPLHQPAAVEGMRVVRALLPDVAQVACFDTAFHATLPPAASTYALPRAWRTDFGMRRFGFHGLSHAYAARRVARLMGAEPADLRVVSCHLGAGASLCAIAGGSSVDTTMGWTPLEGLVMATRSGSVDPGVVLAVARRLGVNEVERALDTQSGVAALSGIPGGDMRAVIEAAARGSDDAELAFAVYVHRLRREIGAMLAAMGGADALVFTGGVGEHASAVRAAAGETLAFAGIAIDPARNRAAEPDAEIGTPQSVVRCFVIAAREDLEIARLVRAALADRRAAA